MRQCEPISNFYLTRRLPFGHSPRGVRSGVPNIITPVASDQCAWAERAVKLGVSPHTPDMKKLTAESLAQAINTAVNDSALRARAEALGQKFQAENGIARAVEVTESQVSDFKQSGF